MASVPIDRHIVRRWRKYIQTFVWPTCVWWHRVEECIHHVTKRHGTALWKLSSSGNKNGKKNAPTASTNDMVRHWESWRLLGIRMERRMHQPHRQTTWYCTVKAGIFWEYEEECINHVAKRFSTAQWKLVSWGNKNGKKNAPTTSPNDLVLRWKS